MINFGLFFESEIIFNIYWPTVCSVCFPVLYVVALIGRPANYFFIFYFIILNLLFIFYIYYIFCTKLPADIFGLVHKYKF